MRPASNAFCNAWKLLVPSASSDTTSPSNMARLTVSPLATSASSGNLVAKKIDMHVVVEFSHVIGWLYFAGRCERSTGWRDA